MQSRVLLHTLAVVSLAVTSAVSQAAITGGYFNNSTGPSQILGTASSTAFYSADNSPNPPLVVVDNDLDFNPATGSVITLGSSLATVSAQNQVVTPPSITTTASVVHSGIGTLLGNPTPLPDVFDFLITSRIETENAVLLSGPSTAIPASGGTDSFARIVFDTSQLSAAGQHPVLLLTSLSLNGSPATETAEWRLTEHDNISGTDLILSLGLSYVGGTAYELNPNAGYTLELRWGIGRPVDAVNTDTQLSGGAILGLSDVAGVAIPVPESTAGGLAWVVLTLGAGWITFRRARRSV